MFQTALYSDCHILNVLIGPPKQPLILTTVVYVYVQIKIFQTAINSNCEGMRVYACKLSQTDINSDCEGMCVCACKLSQTAINSNCSGMCISCPKQ